MTGVTLNEGQAEALSSILTAQKNGLTRYLLTGYAGSGKTTLMQAVADALDARGQRVVVTAPTHKAVKVLKSKVGDDVATMTIHALLGLRPQQDDEKSTLKRSGRSLASGFAVVIIDECSMVSSDLWAFIDNDLRTKFVLCVGDPAQLPPVGEVASPSFALSDHTHLGTIVRQAAGNPILEAAALIRGCQGKEMDWSWVRQSESGSCGVYLAGSNVDEWLEDAFTSEAFTANNDAFRYLAWTNARVDEVNRKVRRWIYGDTPTPYVPGEKVVCRTPIEMPGFGTCFSANEEALVASIEPTRELFSFQKLGNLEAWSVSMPVWRVSLEREGQDPVPCIIPQRESDRVAMDRRLVAEAKINRGRWFERFEAAERLSRLQAIYAMTVHTSQGSTFGYAFIDLPDISKRMNSNLLEMQQLLYVAMTRASEAAVLVGAL